MCIGWSLKIIWIQPYRNNASTSEKITTTIRAIFQILRFFSLVNQLTKIVKVRDARKYTNINTLKVKTQIYLTFDNKEIYLPSQVGMRRKSYRLRCTSPERFGTKLCWCGQSVNVRKDNNIEVGRFYSSYPIQNLP